MKLYREGIALGYEDVGAGDPPLLLVHGWGTRRSIFKHLVPAASARHRVVAIDLRGHGESDAPLQDYSVEAYADDLTWVASALGLDHPVVVGHSLGGFVALEFAARVPACAAVVLECHVAAPPEAAAAIRPAVERLESEAYRATAGAILTMLLGKHFDPTERDALLAYTQELPQRVLALSLRAALAYDNQRAAAQVRCPVLYVGTSTPYADLARFRELCPQLVTGQVIGCGHYFPLEVPDQLNPMILRFIDLFVARSASPSNAYSLRR